MLVQPCLQGWDVRPVNIASIYTAAGPGPGVLKAPQLGQTVPLTANHALNIELWPLCLSLNAALGQCCSILLVASGLWHQLTRTQSGDYRGNLVAGWYLLEPQKENFPDYP